MTRPRNNRLARGVLGDEDRPCSAGRTGARSGFAAGRDHMVSGVGHGLRIDPGHHLEQRRGRCVDRGRGEKPPEGAGIGFLDERCRCPRLLGRGESGADVGLGLLDRKSVV